MNHYKFRYESKPDNDGYYIALCEKCKKYFLINPNNAYNEELDNIFCPYCQNNRNLTNYISAPGFKLTSEFYDIGELNDEIIDISSDSLFDDELGIEEDELIKLEDFRDILYDVLEESYDDNIDDYELFSYDVNTVDDEQNYLEYEFLCCGRKIKYDKTQMTKILFCPFCGVEHNFENEIICEL